MRPFFAMLFAILIGASSASAASFANLATSKNKCLDVKDGKFANGGGLQLWDCAQGSTNQQFKLSNGQLVTGQNKCVDVVDGKAVNGGRIQLWDCASGNDNQKWELAGSSLRHTGTNLCLDVKDGNFANGASLQLWGCDFRSTGHQVWSFGSSSSQAAPSTSSATSGATTFYGYSAISIDDFMAKNPGCAWIKDAVVAAAADQGINATFLATACIVESSCLKTINNPWGPFQFSDEGAWAAYGGAGKNRQNIWDAAYGAARYFKDLLGQTNGNLDEALRLYNGPLSQGGNPQYQNEFRCWMRGGNAWEDVI